MFPTRFIFNHFPKAGGTSLLAVCKHNIPGSEISPHLMELDIRLARPERFERYRLIRGHFSLLTQMGFSLDRYSITSVRHPISTILSTYNFWRTRPEEDPVTSLAKRMSFSEFVRRFAASPTIINNAFTHHFAALGRDYPGEPDDSSLLLATAKQNLAAFHFVGICEQFEETVRLLCHETGWHLPEVIPHENRSRRAESHDTIDPETMQALVAQNQLDLQLYDFAKTLFRTRIEHAAQPYTRPDTLAPAAEPNSIRRDESPAPNRFLAFPTPTAARRLAEILSVSAQPGPQGQTSAIIITYQATEKITELIAGIVIYDSEGNVISATNTMIESMELTYEPRRREHVTFKLPYTLPPGTYSISAALARSDRPGFHYDWVDRATVFEIAHAPSVESRIKLLVKKTLRPISQRIYGRIDNRLRLHLLPIESELEVLERTTASVRDRMTGLHDAIAALRVEQAELRKELAQLSHEPTGEVR